MKNKFLLILFLFLTFVIYSCKENSTTEIPDLGYNYFPTNVGHYIIYDVDSMKKDGFSGEVTKSKYQIKEVIESVFTDNQGRSTLRIERYRKDSVYYPEWTIYNVWTANLTATVAERFENNIRYIKLVFPIEYGKTWNGNAMNTDVEEDYEYIGVDEQMMVNNINFDSVTTVLQADELFNFVSPKYKMEQYAAGVGLIYRKKLELQTQIDTLTGLPDTSSYIDYTESISSFGN